MLEFLKWFFMSPTPIITSISVCVALAAYINQRKQVRKQNAYKVAAKYAEDIIPRSRYINSILQQTGLKEYISVFIGFEKFTVTELNDFLKKVKCTSDDFKDKLNTINNQMLEIAFLHSGCSGTIVSNHNSLKEAVNCSPNNIGIAFYKFILDFLNDMESMAMLFHYNIADEKLVYQTLHQTFLKNIENWYFFISDENRIDEDRYFRNIIWLYQLWHNRKVSDAKKLDDIVHRSTLAKKL